MTDKTKIAVCYTAIAISTIFLVVAVDHFPFMACWLPLIITLTFTLRCDAFRNHLNKKLDKICPIE